ncbi:MAG TPA: D-glycero-beta-D-manno-heptose 1,7-bisphosphate 7-phosphatase [Gammaproteobacteria bacterium]|nr:D-glycero-beta-D-manno-heptose 1,7-bisphosphate 7-phosphatase [Gammaproteobacteria bacterium]
MHLIILDRDGVINEDSESYIKSPSEWIPIAGSLEAIARLNHAGYHVAVLTNQSGIARGLYDLDTLMRIHDKMHHAAAAVGGSIDAVLFCPHGPDEGCSCRKPKPGLFQELGARLHIPLTEVPAVGDSMRDLEAAQSAGARPILVRTGKGRETEAALEPGHGIAVYDDLAAATDALLKGASAPRS